MINLIIPSFNRYSHLKRMLSFFCEYNLSEIKYFKIFILDSSEIKTNDSLLKNIIKKLNIEYIKFNSDIFIVQKIQMITSSLTEKFTIILADDDIVDLKRLIEYQKFMEINKEYSCVTGISLFDDFGHDLYFKNLKKTVEDYSIVNEDYKNRIKKYSLLSNIGNPFYGIIRTELFCKIWDQMSEFVFFWYYPEILFNYSILLSGKFLVFDNISTVRNLNDSLFNDTESLNIMNEERNKKSINLFTSISPSCDKEFILDQLRVIKKTQMKIISRSTNNVSIFEKIKKEINKIIFHFINKNIYYDKIDSNSEEFYNNVLKFYNDNALSNKEIILSRNKYKDWM